MDWHNQYGNIVRDTPNYRYLRLHGPYNASHLHITLVFHIMSDEELSKIDALIAQHSVNEVFDGPQLRYSAAKSVRYGEKATSNKEAASNVPHGGYRCHRCGEAGHFITDCPQATGEEPAGKVRQARGLPKAFLQAVSEEEAAKPGSGAFISADGNLVVLKSATVEERLRLVGPSSEVAITRFFGNCATDAKTALACFICGELAREPTTTPCCGELFCRQCILKHLDRTYTSVDGSVATLECPHCDRTGLNAFDLIPDKTTSQLLSQILGVEMATSTNTTLGGVSQVTTKHRKVATGLDVEMTHTEDAIVNEKGSQSAIKRHSNTVLISGGVTNPFFGDKSTILTEPEFEEWRKRYLQALLQAGYEPLLKRRYPDMTLN